MRLIFDKPARLKWTPLKPSGDLDFDNVIEVDFAANQIVEGDGDVAYCEGSDFFDWHVLDGDQVGIIHGVPRADVSVTPDAVVDPPVEAVATEYMVDGNVFEALNDESAIAMATAQGHDLKTSHLWKAVRTEAT